MWVLKSHSICDSNFKTNSNSLKARELYWPSQQEARLDIHMGRSARHVLRFYSLVHPLDSSLTGRLGKPKLMEQCFIAMQQDMLPPFYLAKADSAPLYRDNFSP